MSNCSLVTVITQSLVVGTAALLAGLVSAGHKPRTVITDWVGATAAGVVAGFSSGLRSVGGVVEAGLFWVAAGCEGAGACFCVFFVWACPSAVAAKRQAINIRTIVKILSQIIR